MGKFSEEVEKENPQEDPEATNALVSDASKSLEHSASTEPTKIEEKEQTFDEWLNEVPQTYKDEINNRVGAGVNKYVEDTYGELLPFLPEIANSKELQKQIARLSNKEYRELALEMAWDIHNGTPAEQKLAKEVMSEIPKEFQDKLTNLEAKVSAKEQEEVNKKYNDGRRTEVEALINEAPELRFNKQDMSDPAYKLASYLIDIAEQRTQKNFDNGLNKLVSYKEVYDEWREVSGKKPLVGKITATTEAGPPKLQAPKNEIEGKKRFRDEVKKAGGFNEYAKILSGKE